MLGQEASQVFDGFGYPVLGPDRQGQVVDRFGMHRHPGEEDSEDLFGGLEHAHPEGEPSEVDQDLVILGHEGQGRLIAGQGVHKIPAPLLGDGEYVPAHTAALVDLEGFDGQFGRRVQAMAFDVSDRAVEYARNPKGLLLCEGLPQKPQGIGGGAGAHQARRGAAGLQGRRRN